MGLIEIAAYSSMTLKLMGCTNHLFGWSMVDSPSDMVLTPLEMNYFTNDPSFVYTWRHAFADYFSYLLLFSLFRLLLLMTFSPEWREEQRKLSQKEPERTSPQDLLQRDVNQLMQEDLNHRDKRRMDQIHEQSLQIQDLTSEVESLRKKQDSLRSRYVTAERKLEDTTRVLNRTVAELKTQRDTVKRLRGTTEKLHRRVEEAIDVWVGRGIRLDTRITTTNGFYG